MAAALGFVLGVEAEVDEGVVAEGGGHEDVAAVAAVAAGGAAPGDELFAAEGHAAVAAVAGFDADFCFIDKHAALASVTEAVRGARMVLRDEGRHCIWGAILRVGFDSLRASVSGWLLRLLLCLSEWMVLITAFSFSRLFMRSLRCLEKAWWFVAGLWRGLRSFWSGRRGWRCCVRGWCLRDGAPAAQTAVDGAIRGVVRDAAGAVVAGASVRVDGGYGWDSSGCVDAEEWGVCVAAGAGRECMR